MGLDEWLLVVDVVAAPQTEDEWNRWYDEVHVPEILECPGFLEGARYVSDGSEDRRYLTIYKISGPDALDSREFAQKRGWRQFAPHVTWTSRIYHKRTGSQST